MEETVRRAGGESAGGNPAQGEGTPPAPAQEITYDQRVIAQLYEAKCEAAKKALPQVLPNVWAYCERHRAAGRMWHPCYPLKLLELWDFLQREKPRTILELGSGCTTAVFAHYESHFGIERFVTVDENECFQDAVCYDVRHGVGVDWVEQRAGAKWSSGGRCGYEGIEVLDGATNVDLLYVDGPSNKSGDQFLVCADAVSLAGAPPKAILFDIRRETVRYTKEFYGDKYHWDDSVWGQKGTPWYLSAIRHHTIARRRA